MARAICQKPAFIFTHIPKTGGTSFLSRRSPVIRQLRPHCKGLALSSGHVPLARMRLGCASSRLDLSKYFKFTIVRNPYDRFISLWKTFKPDDSLDNFIEYVKKPKLKRSHRSGILTQSYWVTNSSNKLIVDHLIYYENYKDGINETLTKLGLPKVNLPHLRRSNRNQDYKQYYTSDEQIKFVQNSYNLDFKLFNYSKELV